MLNPSSSTAPQAYSRLSKVKSVFSCQNCGAQFPKWMGQCSSCKSWNTISEEVVRLSPVSEFSSSRSSREGTIPLNEIKGESTERISLGIGEFDRLLGGGLVPGSVTLLGGAPGVGKSTLLLQLSVMYADKVLYVSGEESLRQIKLRADRLDYHSENCYILAETRTQGILLELEALSAPLVIVDSVQTLHSDLIEAPPGSVSQIRQCTAELIRFAKETHTAVILVGHITKDGGLAGPKLLEHMVDTVLQFEGDAQYGFRVLRSLKNRFGSTSELGIFEMQGSGLREVLNPSELLLSRQAQQLSGTAVASTLEGVRPLFAEIQSLVSSAVYGTPQRSSTGFPVKRLQMLLAVLERRAGFALGSKDVFVNVTGGIQLTDPAMDLAVIAAILSSHADRTLPIGSCFAAEVGLAGEIREVQRLDARIAEAEKLGFRSIYVASTARTTGRNKSINVVGLETVKELVDRLFSA